jgi:hypothetical protein
VPGEAPPAREDPSQEDSTLLRTDAPEIEQV